MKIAIDLNDVVRDFSRNFARCYNDNYDHTFDFTDFEFWTNNMKDLFPFRSDAAFERFTYEDYAYDLFASCPTCYSSLTPDFNNWVEHTVKELDIDEDIVPIVVSTMEYGLSIPSTLVFIGKLGSKIREIYLPVDSATIWDKCDVLITANPSLLENKPDGKISVKIKSDYNEGSEADFTFRTFKEFMKDENNIKNIIEYGKQ